MRTHTVRFFTLALAAGALACLPAADAQQASPPPAADVQQAASTPLSAPTGLAALAIPAPPGAKLRFEMDARSEDLLGLIKSLLKGIGETRGPLPVAGGATAGAANPSVNPIEDALLNGNLADILKDVNHVHFAVWEMAPSPAPSADPPAPTVKPGKAAAAALAAPTPVIPAPPMLDTNSYYEDAFAREGAHRILFTDADQARLVMVGFPDRRGFAFAVSGAGYVAVSRSDGYPNMEALSSFLSRITAAVMKTKTGKQMMDGVTDGVTGALPGGKDAEAGGGKK